MRTDLKVSVLRSALLALLPQHVLSNGRCTCGGNCPHDQALAALDLTRPEHHFVVASDAPSETNGNGISIEEHAPPSVHPPEGLYNAARPTQGSEGS